MRRKDITYKILKKLYNKKLLSRREIALFLKCNITTIYKKMEKFGIPAREQKEASRIAMRKQIIKISKYQLENLYFKKKLSISEIAKKLNYCRETIEREFEKHKISLRSHSETMKLIMDKDRIKKSLLLELYWRKKLTPKQIGKNLKKHPETIRRLMREYFLKRRPRSEISTCYQKFSFSGNLKEKAYLIGFRIGDLRVKLSTSKNLILADCTSTKIEQINLFKNLFGEYGHIWVGKPRENGNRVFAVRLNRTFDFLLPKKDCIPWWIRKNSNYFLSFFAGYIDAEGCIRVGKNNMASLTISSYEKNILKQFHQGLLKMKIECNPPRIHVKKGHIKSDGCVYRNDEWSFSITKKYYLLAVLLLLKSRLRHQKRLKDLIIAEQNINERNKNLL